MPYLNIRLKVSDELADIFQNRIHRGGKTFFLDSLISSIETQDPEVLYRRVKQIIMGDFRIVFGDEEMSTPHNNAPQTSQTSGKIQKMPTMQVKQDQSRNALEDLNQAVEDF